MAARQEFLTHLAKALLITALVLCSAAAFAQTAVIQSQDAAQMAVTCPAILCNCMQGSDIACQAGSCVPTIGCGSSVTDMCDGCR